MGSRDSSSEQCPGQVLSGAADLVLRDVAGKHASWHGLARQNYCMPCSHKQGRPGVHLVACTSMSAMFRRLSCHVGGNSDYSLIESFRAHVEELVLHLQSHLIQ